MADYNGKFQYLAEGADGAVAQEGACRIQFDAETLTLTPDSGAALAFDLGDLNAVTAVDYEIRLPLYTGKTVLLRQFGRAYETLAHDLLEAYRQRSIQCLLLEDLQEIARFPATFELTAAGNAPQSGPAELRLYKSNLAVLPAVAQSFQWRLADVDSVDFDAEAYEVVLQSGDDRLRITRLAKRTEEFVSKVREAMSDLAMQSAHALHTIFPFLSPDQVQTTGGLLREGQSAAVGKLAAIHPKIPVALAANAVDKDLQPCYDQLIARTANGMLYAGFKLIRQEAGGTPANEGADSPKNADATAASNSNSDEESADTAAPDADAGGPETLYWFFFPMAAGKGVGNVVAWEASSRSGRATYFFRLVDPAQAAQLQDPARAPAVVDAAVRRLNRVLGMLNFRRRPIYLSDDDLAMDPQYHRYAIAARRMAEVREVRASFLGRAVHSSPEAWQAQVATILVKAGVPQK